MKKGMILSAALSVVGLMLVSCSSRPRDDHNHDASNHGYDGSTATYYWRADNDNNDAHRRLLIAKAGRG